MISCIAMMCLHLQAIQELQCTASSLSLNLQQCEYGALSSPVHASVTCRHSAIQGPQHHGAVQRHPYSAHHVPPQASSICGSERPHLSHAVQGPTPAHHTAPGHDPPLDDPQQQSPSPVSAGMPLVHPNLACPTGSACKMLAVYGLARFTSDMQSCNLTAVWPL